MVLDGDGGGGSGSGSGSVADFPGVGWEKGVEWGSSMESRSFGPLLHIFVRSGIFIGTN